MKTILNSIVNKLFGNSSSNLEYSSPDAEINDAEEFLKHHENWPQEVYGHFYFLDDGSWNGNYAHWMIGTFEDKRFNDSILVEFKGSILEDAEIDVNHEFSTPIKLWINRAVEEYYQVERIELTSLVLAEVGNLDE